MNGYWFNGILSMQSSYVMPKIV